MVQILSAVLGIIVIGMGGYGMYAGMSEQYTIIMLSLLGVVVVLQFVGIYKRIKKLNEIIGKDK